MRGITPVVAIILLLLITISIVGFAFIFFQRTTETASQAGQEQLQQQLSSLATQPRIASMSGDTIYIQNVGSTNLDKASLAFFVDGQKLAVTAGPDSLSPNQVAGYQFTGFSAGAAKSVKVTSGGLQDTVTRTIRASCKEILSNSEAIGDGLYKINPAGTEVNVYCDMTTDGGGWTLVWSSLRGDKPSVASKPVTGITWNDAINTLPKITGVFGTNLEAFNFYLGLKFWEALGSTIRYDWANDYGSPIDQRFYATFSFDETSNYKIVMSEYQQKIGSRTAGLWDLHNNLQFSTFDADHDTLGGNCAVQYSNTPFWYDACWSGSINGGGENEPSGHKNAAYWFSSQTQWGTDPDTGGGNGWIYVR